MAFPTIPTGTRVVTGLDTVGGATKTFPSLTGLTKNPGDLLIAICMNYDANSTNAEFSSWGAGFTEFADFATTTTSGIGLAHKWSTGIETGTFTVTTADSSTSDTAFFLLSIPGAHSVTPPEAGGYATAVDAAADPTSVNPANWDVEDTLWIAVTLSGEVSTTGSWTGVASAPTSYTDYAQTGLSADVAGAVEGAVAFRQLRASSEDAGVFSVDTSNARNASCLIAVRPNPEPTAIRQKGQSFPPGRGGGSLASFQITADSAVPTALKQRAMPRKPLAEALEPFPSGPTIFEQALTATVTTAASIVKQVGFAITATTATATAAIVKQVDKLVAATTVTSTATIQALKVAVANLTANATSTASIVRDVGKLVTATTVTATATIVKNVGKLITATTVTATASMVAIKVILLTMTATTVTATASIVRQVGKILEAPATSTASIVKGVGKLVTATTVTATASIVAIKTILLAMTATTVTATASIVRQVGFAITATATTTASIVKQVGKTITATTATAAASIVKQVGKLVTATATVTASFLRAIAFAITATATATASIVKSVTKTLTATASSTASMVADFVSGVVSFMLGFFDHPSPGGGDAGSPEATEYDKPTPGGGDDPGTPE
jgi:hypothetical protein